MNKFRKFFGRISAETCLKLNYFISKKSCQALGGFAPKPPLND